MTEPVEDTRNELISIVRNVIEENFNVEGYIVDAFDVTIIGVSYSTAVIHLNGLFLGTFHLEELYVSPSPVIVSSILQKIAVENCNDLRGLFAISVLR